MQKSNPANTPAEVGLRLEKEPEEEIVDPTTYKKLMGSLRYLCNTRPDLSFSVGGISKYMHDPRISHHNVAKRILRYLQGTHMFGILVSKEDKGNGLEVAAYSDEDWCEEKWDRKSIVGYIFFLRKCDALTTILNNYYLIKIQLIIFFTIRFSLSGH